MDKKKKIFNAKNQLGMQLIHVVIFQKSNCSLTTSKHSMNLKVHIS